jgi:prephenate dehydratase
VFSRQLVAIQGEPGSFSAAAAQRFMPAPRITCFDSFEEVVDSVACGISSYGVLPVSNSLAGRVLDLDVVLAGRDLVASRELWLPIRQCLIAPREIDLARIREVHSHRIALRQCRRFLRKHSWIVPVEAPDTAGAVRIVCKSGRSDLAAIAGSDAAGLYGGVVLVEGIADRPDNITLFVLVEPRRSVER